MKSTVMHQLAQLRNVKQLPDFDDEETERTFQMFEFCGFINTLEGWNLYARCMASGNMEPYKTAKVLYDQERRMNEAQFCAEETR